MHKSLISFLILLSVLVLIVPSVLAASSLETFCVQKYGTMDQCNKELAVKRDDPSYCHQIGETGVRNSCYTYFAKKRNDPSFCDPVRKMSNSFSSIFTCYKPFIKSMSNITICDSFVKDTETQDECYEHIYDKQENTTICFKYYDPEKKIKCFSSAARQTFDLRYCDAIQETADMEYCKDNEIDECDTTAHLNDAVNECKTEAALRQRRSRCNEHNDEILEEFTVGDKSDLLFDDDNPEIETFNVNIANVDLTTDVATVELTLGRHKTPYNVRIGNVMKHDFINMIVVNIWGEEQESADENADPVVTNKVELCFYRDFKPEDIEEDEEIEEPEANIPEETENITEETPVEPTEEVSEEEETETEEYAEKEIEDEEGFVRRTIRWFFGLFGLGK